MRLKILIDTNTEAANVHLLKELDRWLELGLLSDVQAISIGQTLSSRLPLVYKAPVEVVGENAVPSSVSFSMPEASANKSAATGNQGPLVSRFKSRLVQSFLAEVSVLWLLFLGVFLVVVSSAVLAASQWQSFSAVGQYGILLVYTIAFAGASRWAAGQSKLQTTAQMLKAATLLLVPLNVWMMDALGLAKASLGLAILASVGLSCLPLMFAPQRRVGLNILGLSWLHWGWGFAAWPLVATYLATVGSATNLVRVIPDEEDAQTGSKPQSGKILVAIALLLLLGRSLWIAQVPIYQLGLAFGICGWMLCRLQQYPLWPQVGTGLMLLGWMVSVAQQPVQAIGVSGLAGWLLLERLRQQPREPDQLSALATLWLLGLQICGLVWLALPLGLRQGLLAVIERWSSEPVSGLNFAGVWLYGYVGLMILGAVQFRHRHQTAWAQLTERLVLGLGVVLVACTLLPQVHLVLLTLSLAGLTVTLAILTHLRRPASNWLIYGTHGSLMAAVLSGLSAAAEQLGGWSNGQWAITLLGLTTVEWIASVLGTRYPEWRCSAWYLGIGLSVIAYGLLLDNGGGWISLIWSMVPGMLTWLVYRQQFAADRPQVATMLAAIALGGQLLLVSSWQMATVALGGGTGLLFLHSCRWPTQKYLPALTVGFIVFGGHTAAIWLWSMSLWPNTVAQLFLLTALFASVLGLLARVVDQRSSHLLLAYGRASGGWSRGLAIALVLCLILMVVLFYALELDFIHWALGFQRTEMFLRYGIAAIILLLARCFIERRLTNWNYWELACGVGLLISMGLLLWRRETQPHILGTAMVMLALVTQLGGTVYSDKKQLPYKSSWHYIPLVYGALGLVLNHGSFTATTGFHTAVVGGITLAIGRRRPDLRPLGYGGLGLLSWGVYELVIHRLLQASGGQPGDGLTLLALVGSAIATLYLLGHRWIQRYSKLTMAGISVVSLLHWLLAVTLATLAMVSGQSRTGIGLWLGLASLLAIYAWLRGNYRWFPLSDPDAPGTTGGQTLISDHSSYSQWTWSGLMIATVAIPYGVFQLLANLTLLRSWGALFACGLSLVIYNLPWLQWGWPPRPWQRMALVWPILALLLSVATVKTQSLLLVGAFYAAMAKRLRAVRLSYVSLGLLNWSLLRYLIDQGWLTPLWLSTMVGLSGLYILAVDPRWQTISARQERHHLRGFATLLIALTAIFQAETASLVFIGLSLLISFSFIGLGLMVQVRAYLYIGTLTFGLQVLRVIMLFVHTDGRMLWAIGIVLGIALIWVAATFEARRTQISGLLHRWSDMLNNWD